MNNEKIMLKKHFNEWDRNPEKSMAYTYRLWKYDSNYASYLPIKLVIRLRSSGMHRKSNLKYKKYDMVIPWLYHEWQKSFDYFQHLHGYSLKSAASFCLNNIQPMTRELSVISLLHCVLVLMLECLTAWWIIFHFCQISSAHLPRCETWECL